MFTSIWHSVDCIRSTVSSFEQCFLYCTERGNVLTSCSMFSRDHWGGALLWGGAEGTGLQPGEKLALGRPYTSLLVSTRRLSKSWIQALYWIKRVREWMTVHSHKWEQEKFWVRGRDGGILMALWFLLHSSIWNFFDSLISFLHVLSVQVYFEIIFT